MQCLKDNVLILEPGSCQGLFGKSCQRDACCRERARLQAMHSQNFQAHARDKLRHNRLLGGDAWWRCEDIGRDAAWQHLSLASVLTGVPDSFCRVSGTTGSSRAVRLGLPPVRLYAEIACMPTAKSCISIEFQILLSLSFNRCRGATSNRTVRIQMRTLALILDFARLSYSVSIR